MTMFVVILLSIVIYVLVKFYCIFDIFQVFVDAKPYNSKPLDELLLKTFGKVKMYDIKHPKWVNQ